MALLDIFKKTSSTFAHLSVTNYFSDRFAKGFSKTMVTTQQTGATSKFANTSKITKYKG